MTTIRRRFRALLPALGLTLALSACTPAQFASWWDSVGGDSSKLSQEQLEQGAQIAESYWQAVIAQIMAAQQDKYAHVLTDDQLGRLRQCESGGNYGAIGGGGAYRGAYQFSQTTWNSIARGDYPHLVGVDPAAAAPRDQDAMARALFAHQGRSPWPVCGYRM